MIYQISDLQRLFDIVDFLVDEHVGIIRHVTELPRQAEAPDFFHFYAEACNTRALSRQQNFANAGGASAERGHAMVKAIGEAVERYCSAIYVAEELMLCSSDAASFQCVQPSTFALYSQEQYALPKFPYVPFDHSLPVRWTQALDLVTSENWYVPASMVFLPYFYDKEEREQPFLQSISTGLACHCSLAEAAISAICEVIERDAFTITWQALLSRPQIRTETLSALNRDLIARFERTGSTVTVLNITMDVGVPTILSVLQNRSPEAPAFVFAASADVNPEQAARKSLEELAHTRRLAQDIKTGLPSFVPDPDYSNVISQRDHVHLYCNHANAPLTEFIFASQERLDFDEIENLATGNPKQDLEILINRIHEVGHRTLLADLTTPDVGALGLSVVRAIITGFHPLVMGHRIRALAGTRLWEVPQKLGYHGITPASGDNPAPHPYP